MNGMRPGSIAVLAGGVVLLLSTFFDWFGSFSVWEGSLFGLTGFFIFLIAAAAIAVSAIRAFAPQVGLPSEILGMTLDQVIAGLGFTVVAITFGLLFRTESAKIGTILALLSSVAIMVGGYLEHQADTPKS